MRFGRVMGHVVLSHSDEKLKGARWLMVSPMGREQFENLNNTTPGKEPSLVVYDNLGASVGDIIGFTEGGEATLPFETPTPVDAYNAIIVDQIKFEG